MGWLESGRGRVRNTNAKNSETKRVQKRLDSVMDPMRAKVVNSLQVDSTPAIVFKRTKTGLPCSCNKYDNDIDSDVIGSMRTVTDVANQPQFEVFSSNNKMLGGIGQLLGSTQADRKSTSIVELADMQADVTEEYSPTAIAGNNVNCCICYNCGIQPAFQPVGWHYNVLTHHHIKAASGYEINPGNQPATLEARGEDAVVKFSMIVPKYFKDVKYSVRNNGTLLPADVYLHVENGDELTMLTMGYLNANRGKEIDVYVCDVPVFTHVSLLFDLGVEPVMVNLSEEQNVLNYDQELTVGDLTVVMQSNVGQIKSEDLIILPEKNYVLKVNNAPKKRTAKNEQWEWALTSRPAQRKEGINSIFKGYKIWK